MTSSLGRWYVFGLIAIIVLLALSSVFALFANVSSYYAKGAEQNWSRDSVELTLPRWQQAASNLHTSLVLAPGHPDYLQSLGRLYSWAGTLPEEVELTAGLEHYLQVAAARPYWPYSWSELAFLKAQMGEFDAEFDTAWDRSLTLGRWENKVSLTLLKIGAYRWRELSKAQRNKAYELFARELNRGNLAARQAIKVVDEYGMRRAWCYAIRKSELTDRAQKLCRIK